jgi:hypothetical protein
MKVELTQTLFVLAQCYDIDLQVHARLQIRARQEVSRVPRGQVRFA